MKRIICDIIDIMNSQAPFKIKKKERFLDLKTKEKTFLVLQIIGIFIVFTSIIFITGLIPKELKESNIEIFDNLEEDLKYTTYTRPSYISIEKIGVDSVIELPNTQNIEILDQSLQKGAVHYPGSGGIEKGNIFIFGHSTNWKIVKNQAYKTFNDLDKLEKGDEIILEADGKKYTYLVDTVNLVNESESLVNLDTIEKKLTISTCNSFGDKQERWVVEAYRSN